MEVESRWRSRPGGRLSRLAIRPALNPAGREGEERSAGRGRAVQDAGPVGGDARAVFTAAGLRGRRLGERRQGRNGDDHGESYDASKLGQVQGSSFQVGRIA